MNLKNILFLFLLSSTSVLLSSFKRPFGADDVLEIFEEAASHDPTPENLARTLQKGQIEKAFQLFEKGAPATEALFTQYLNAEELTTTRKENAKKIFAQLPEISQKKIARYTLTEAISDKEPATALFALELGAQAKEEHISTFLYKVDMGCTNEGFLKRIKDNIQLFEKLLKSVDVIPSSDLFLPAAQQAPRFAAMLLQKGTKPHKGDLAKIFSSSNCDFSHKEAVAKLVLATAVELTDDEIIYLRVNMPQVAQLRVLTPNESMQSKIDAQIKEKESKEKEKSQKQKDFKNIGENLLKELPDDMKEEARYLTVKEIKDKIDERKSRNTLFISTAVVGTVFVAGFITYKYKQFKKQQEEQEKKDKQKQAYSIKNNELHAQPA